MTLLEIYTEIWEHTGEINDLDPSVDATRLTWVVNEGQRQVAFWKDPVTQRPLRIHSLMGELFFTSSFVSSTLDADAPADNKITFPGADVSDQESRYNGWIAESGGQSRIITSYNNYIATLHKDWDTTPSSGDTYKLYKRFWLIVDSSDPWQSEHITIPASSTKYRTEGNLLGILKIEDLEDEVDLRKAAKGRTYPSLMMSTGTPNRWWQSGRKLYMDYCLDEARTFKAEYLRHPTKMSAASDTPEIPEIFHWGIVLWGIMWGFSREQEAPDKYSAKRDFLDFMRQTKSVYEMELESIEDYGSLQIE